jgi:hypothetical protein
VKNLFSDQFELGSYTERDQDSEQQKSQPGEKATEVVAGGGEHGVDGVAACMGEVIAAHAGVFLEVTDDRLDGGASFELALDLRRDAALLAALCSGGALWPR